MFQNRTNEILHKEPGSLDGGQFKIEDCTNCEIFIEDRNAGGFMDDVQNCTVLWGPSAQSVFVRTVQNSRIVMICQ